MLTLDFIYYELPNSDPKDNEIIAKRSIMLLLSAFIYDFFKEKIDFDKSKAL